MNAHAIIAASARTVTPLAALFAFSLLAVGGPGDGVGFRAGLAFALVVAIHLLVFGARASRKALPLAALRLMLALGVVAVAGAQAAGYWSFAPQLAEAGLFFATAATVALVLGVVVGRAPTLRDQE